MHKHDERVIDSLIKISKSSSQFSNELDEVTLNKFDALRISCEEQGTKDEEEWFIEISQAFSKLYVVAPSKLKDALGRGVET
jgi:hypothetical protein